MDLKFYASRFLGRAHWFALTFLSCVAMAIAVASMMATTYIAEARLIVESEQIPDEMAASTVLTQATEQLQIIQQRILTRSNLVEMAVRLGIYADHIARGEAMPTAEAIGIDLRNRISIQTTGDAAITRRGDRQATIVSVAFEAPSSELAAAVTNEIVGLIVHEDVSMRTGAAQQTLAYFDGEVRRIDTLLSRKSSEVLRFKGQHLAALPDSLDFRRAQQALAQERLRQLDRSIAELQDRRARLARLQDSASIALPMSPDQHLTNDESQLRQAQDELTRQLAVLSPGNPKIQLLRAQIDSLQALVAAQSPAAGLDSDGGPLSIYQVQLADIDGQISYLGEQATLSRAELETLQLSIAETAGNALALDILQRDQDALLQQYNQAVANQAKAETGNSIETLSKGQRIAVIEDAIAPSAPAGPKKRLILAAGIAGGLALGLALVALLEMLDATIKRPEDLASGLGITVFATIPYLDSPSARQSGRWRRNSRPPRKLAAAS